MPGTVCAVCKGAGTNGVDLSIDAGREQAIKCELSPPPCCERMGNGQWCTRHQGHVGNHHSMAEAVYGPIEATPPLWRKHRGQQQTKDPVTPAPVKAEPASELIT